MKLTKMIVNANKALIGFMVEGKASEFGEVGTARSERAMQLSHMWNMRFNNSQALFSNGTITEKGNFHINQLGMIMLNGSEAVEIENTLTLTSRYVQNNENIGFGVRFGNGDNNKYKYADVMKLAEMFRPTNFVIKINTAGKQFIAGKNGSPLSSLPVIVIGETTRAKKTKSGAKPVTPVTGGKMTNDIDILDIFGFVNRCNGFIIKFKDTEYKATSASVASLPEAFKSMNIGEVASPKLDFNETKFNASCKFKNPGVIELATVAPSSTPTFAGASTNQLVYTYVYRSKNIFYNGEHHLTKIGLIIPADKEKELFASFGSSLAITEVTDTNVISVVNRLINWKDSKIFEVDTSKLALISPSKYSKFILKPSDIYKHTLDLAVAKICMKYVRGELKALADKGIVAPPKGRTIAPQFSMKSKEELDRLVDAGIDVFTGAFTEKGKFMPTGPGKDPDQTVEVSYVIDGFDPKNFSYDKIISNPEKNRPEVNTFVTKISSVGDLVERAKLLNEVSVELGKREEAAKRALWFHKASMWIKSGKRGVHEDDKANWVINTKKRTKATCYNCNVPEANGLQLLVLHTDIVK